MLHKKVNILALLILSNWSPISGNQISLTPIDARQSSTEGSFNPDLGVSGRCTSGGDADYAKTTQEFKPMWFIDMGQIYVVEKVIVSILNKVETFFSNTYFLVSNNYPSFSVRNIDYREICYYNDGSANPGNDLEIVCSEPLRGRYFSIISMQNSKLAFCNLRIYKYNGDYNQLDLKKNLEKISVNTNKAVLTSMFDSRSAAQAFNGDCRYTGSNWNVAMTNNEEMPMWYVDMEQSQNVGIVQLGTAMENSNFFLNAYVMVSDTRPDINNRHKDFTDVCAHIKGPGNFGEIFFVDCYRKGRFLTVILSEKSFLILCNVIIYKSNLPSNHSEIDDDHKERLILDPNRAEQSSTLTVGADSYPASKAITGDCRTSQHAYSSTTTELKPFLTVDMEQSENVGIIKVDLPLTNKAPTFSDAYFIVSNKAFDKSERKFDGYCDHYHGVSGKSVLIRCNRYGRYLTILLDKKEKLQLCGLMVYKGMPQWAAWSSWSKCSISCGTGVQTRRRECPNMESSLTGCSGSSFTSRSCTMNDCGTADENETTFRCWVCDDCPEEFVPKKNMKLLNSCKMCTKTITKTGTIHRHCLLKTTDLNPTDDGTIVYHCESDACNVSTDTKRAPFFLILFYIPLLLVKMCLL